MTKLIVFATLLFISSVSMAMPAIGDYALYNLQYTVNNQTGTGTVEQTLSGFNPATGKFTLQQVITVNGLSQSSSSEKSANELLSEQQIQQAMTYCTYLQGTLQTITVSAGVFNTCAIPSNSADSSGTVWLGLAPFGVIKADLTYIKDAKHIVYELGSFRAGH